ncbi:hypothetical protein BSIN_5337 [Burkholderia singularis]|uniref:Uncharacterized protein n=1 Tax=Burkholderia singularis TaxID=1503053 RepID=A0A238HE66_9BURK|nr:hypothetical protein BSIN_5337 [Burkholderia singularis]
MTTGLSEIRGIRLAYHAPCPLERRTLCDAASPRQAFRQARLRMRMCRPYAPLAA